MASAELYKTGKCYPISIAAIATTAIYTPEAGRRFCVEKIYLKSDAANVITFKSGTTAISGPITMAAADVISESSGGDVPVFIGRVAAEAFQITTTAADQVSGWVLITEIA